MKDLGVPARSLSTSLARDIDPGIMISATSRSTRVSQKVSFQLKETTLPIFEIGDA